MSVDALSRGTRAAAVLICVAAGILAPAQATTFALGTLSAPADFAVGNSGLSGLFEDSYTFSIAAGTSLAFSGRLETPPSNRFWIGDLNAELFHGSDSLVQGTAERTDIPGGFPVDSVTFASLQLGSGDYRLQVGGNATGAFEGITSSYSGTLKFAGLTTPVPEPGTLALMLAGLGGLALWARSRGMARQRRALIDNAQEVELHVVTHS